MNRKTCFLLAGISGALFAVLIVVLRTVDVAAIGPEGTEIGLSAINGAVQSALPFQQPWYEISEILGTISLAVAAAFALAGCAQLVQRKSLKRVDRSLIELGGLYVAVMMVYALFEVVIINYRPVIMPGDAAVEASFPSSHTMLSCVIMGSAAMVLSEALRDGRLRSAVRLACLLLAASTVICRLCAGVHWFTDIVGGILLSLFLLFAFAGVFYGADGTRA